MAKTQHEHANYYTKKNGEWILTPEFKEYQKNVRDAPHGTIRRAKLLELFDKGLEFPVNRRGCPIISKDPDLKKLLKDGKIELFNVRLYSSMKTSHVRKK